MDITINMLSYLTQQVKNACIQIALIFKFPTPEFYIERSYRALREALIS